MFIALYRLKAKEGQEERFQEGWHRRTVEIYQKCGSLGSRLHKAEDGTWVAYAQWPSKEAWELLGNVPVDDVGARAMFLESIEESYPSILMEVVDDLLQKEKFES